VRGIKAYFARPWEVFCLVGDLQIRKRAVVSTPVVASEFGLALQKMTPEEQEKYAVHESEDMASGE
jgi:hypothetical protein